MSAEVTVHRRQLPDLGEVARNLTAVFADPKTVFGIKLGSSRYVGGLHLAIDPA